MTGMTGFGHGEHRDEKVHLVLEMRSYNNRFLELYLNLPYSLRPLEPRFRELLSSRIQRGKVELYLSLTELESEAEVHVDHARVTAYLGALEELKRLSGSRERVSLSHLIGLEGVLKSESRRDPEDLWHLVLPLLERVLAELQRSRDVEGTKPAPISVGRPRSYAIVWQTSKLSRPGWRSGCGKGFGSDSAS